MVEPLRKLTHKNQPWEWKAEQQLALNQLKNKICEDTTMVYYDTKQPTEVIVDASPVGLGALLTQNGRVVAYASKALSPVQRRYSQIEREALAIMWACTHFYLYLYGCTFKVITDHKPLMSIFNNPNSKPPLRIERWVLRLQTYDFTVSYRRGKDNPADYMSRHPNMQDLDQTEEELTEKYAAFVLANAAPKALSQDEIRLATESDHALQEVIRAIGAGRWHDVSIPPSFQRIKDQLAVKDGIVLRDHRIGS